MVHIPVYAVVLTDQDENKISEELCGVFSDFWAAKAYSRKVFVKMFPELVDKMQELGGGFWYDTFEEKQKDKSVPFIVKRVMICEHQLNEGVSWINDSEEEDET